MGRLDRIQRISTVFRYLLIIGSALIVSAVVIALVTPGQDWVSVGDGRFIAIWHSQGSDRPTLMAIMAPVACILILGLYWLQRLFGEYQAGRFFTNSNMRCYTWLVWLKVASFLYGIIWPQLLLQLASATATAELSLTLDAGTLVELIVLLLIVHLLKEAQQLNDENKAFV